MAEEGRHNRDQPASTDRLGFGLYVAQLASMIRESNDRGHLPLTIGVYGPWGSGKTSLMRMVEQALVPPSETLRRAERREWRRRVAPWFYLGFVLAFAAVVLGFVLTQGPASVVARLFAVDAERTGVWVWCTMLFGALGGILRGAFEVWRHATVEHDGEEPVGWLTFVRPLVGLVLGALPYVVLAAPWKRSGTAVIPVFLAPAIYVIAFALGAGFDWIARALARLARRDRGDDRRRARRSKDHYQVIWFQAWKYTREKELWAALLQRLLTELEVNAYGWARLRIRWKLWARSVLWNSGGRDVAMKLAPTVGKAIVTGLLAAGGWIAAREGAGAGAPVSAAALTGGGLLGLFAWARHNVATPLAGLDLDKYRRRSSHTKYLTFLAQFSDELTRLAKIARGAGNPIVIMLDDLDRCLPEQAVSVLESMKLFVGDDAPVVFVMGVDREFIERAIEVKYDKVIQRGDDRGFGREYLEKIVQLPFNLPPIARASMEDFVRDSFPDNEQVKRLAPVFAAGVPSNPRQMLRVVEIFRFIYGIAERRGDVYLRVVDPAVLAKLVIVQYRWPALYAELIEKPDLLERVERIHRDESVAGEPLEEYAKISGLRALLLVEGATSLRGINLWPYLHIAARAQGDAAIRPAAAPAPSTTDLEAARAELALLDADVKKLTDKGGDAPLIASVSGKRRDVEDLLAQNNVATAAAVIAELRRATADGLARLEREPARKAIGAGGDGLPVVAGAPNEGDRGSFPSATVRAISYAPLSLHVQYASRGRLRLLGKGTFGTRMHESPIDDLLASLFADGEASTDRYRQMGRALGDAIRPIVEGALSQPTRIDVTRQDARVERIPWEMLLVDDRPLALDPRHSLARALSARERRAARHMRRVLRLVPTSVAAPEGAATLWLRSNGVEVRSVAIGADEISDAVAFAPDVVQVMVSSDWQARLATWLAGIRELSAPLVVIDSNAAASAATLAEKIDCSAIVTWLFPTDIASRSEFYLGFYQTLARTGQVDLAVTEGRRRVAAKIGEPPIDALSPVLYLDPSTDGVLFTS